MSKRLNFQFDRDKAVEVVLYITTHARIPDRFHVCKILYFADRYHLENYARLICGDYYAAMPHGAVPSNTYNLIVEADDGNIPAIAVDDVNVIPLREANLEVFSESDLEALNWAIAEYGSLEFGALWRISHDDHVWKQVTQDGALIRSPYTTRSIPIPMEEIVSVLKDKDELLEYLYEYC